jgi:hypothetical protein
MSDFSPGSEGMPTLSSAAGGRDGHRSSAGGDRLRRQMDYSEDETIVVDAPDAYASTDEPSADGNLTLRFGYGGGYQPPQQYNPYGGKGFFSFACICIQLVFK